MQTNQAEYYLLDVFTDQRYGGNQLAIFPDASFIPEKLLQSIARELNLSETVFLFPPSAHENYRMRIFTPGTELPTAGHPTVGTGFFLARKFTNPEEGRLKLTFEQKVGPIDVYVDFTNNLPEMVTMHQPLPTFGHTHNERKADLANVLSLEPSDIADLPIQEVSCGNNTLLIPLVSAKKLREIEVKTDVWKKLKPEFGNGFLYVFSVNDVAGGNVQGRMFAPEIGIMEDPATGSANGPLASYLTKHQIIPMPALSLQGYEMGRPSQIHIDTQMNTEGVISAVKVGGKSVLMGKGTFFLE